MCCTKGVFAEPGWSSYGQKRIPRLEADRSLGDERLVCHLDWKFYLPRLVFTELSSVTKTPRLQRHWKSSISGRSGRRQDNEIGPWRQRSQGCTACTDWVTIWWCTFCPSALLLVNLIRNFFRGSVPISYKKKLSQFLLKKTGLVLWMSNNICLVVVGTYFWKPFCEMHSVVTVKTVVHFKSC